MTCLALIATDVLGVSSSCTNLPLWESFTCRERQWSTDPLNVTVMFHVKHKLGLQGESNCW